MSASRLPPALSTASASAEVSAFGPSVMVSRNSSVGASALRSARCAMSAQSFVATMVRTIFAQPDVATKSEPAGAALRPDELAVQLIHHPIRCNAEGRAANSDNLNLRRG